MKSVWTWYACRFYGFSDSAPMVRAFSPKRFISTSSVVPIYAQIFPSLRPARMPSSAPITAALTAKDGKQVIGIPLASKNIGALKGLVNDSIDFAANLAVRSVGNREEQPGLFGRWEPEGNK